MAEVSDGKKRILVVEDNDDTRAILHALLTHHGYRVLATATAEDMLERFEELRPDLVILDIRLPGMDGCQALDRLRALGFTGPAFLFSQYYDLIAARINACPHDGFFPKSKGPLELVTAIGRRLRGSGAPN